MCLYLGHTQPGIVFAVHQCAHYTFQPKQSHKPALKHISCYPKRTLDMGIILDQDNNYNIDCYQDADFACLFGYEHPQDPHCVRSRTGYVICLAECLVPQVRKLQTELALLTMGPEYIALSTSCKDLLPIVDFVKEIGTFFRLPV